MAGGVYLDIFGGEADLIIDRHGEPRMTAGLETAAALSLFEPPGWRNAIAGNYERAESRIPEVLTEVLKPQTRRRAEQAAAQAMGWMVEAGAADEVETRAEIASPSRLDLAARIAKPGEPALLRYGINWDAMDATGEPGREHGAGG